MKYVLYTVIVYQKDNSRYTYWYDNLQEALNRISYEVTDQEVASVVIQHYIHINLEDKE